jgi:hypothetical protein
MSTTHASISTIPPRDPRKQSGEGIDLHRAVRGVAGTTGSAIKSVGKAVKAIASLPGKANEAAGKLLWRGIKGHFKRGFEAQRGRGSGGPCAF